MTNDPPMTKEGRVISPLVIGGLFVIGHWRRLGLALIFTLPAGCKPNKRYDLIEAELRTRDRELAATRQQLDASRNLNRAYEFQQPAGFPGAPPGVPTGAAPVVFVREIAATRH